MGLAWGLIFFVLRVASRQNTPDSKIATTVLSLGGFETRQQKKVWRKLESPA